MEIDSDLIPSQGSSPCVRILLDPGRSIWPGGGFPRSRSSALFIEPGSPWENGYVESLIRKLRDELLSGEVLDTLEEAKALVEPCRKAYNCFRLRRLLG